MNLSFPVIILCFSIFDMYICITFDTVFWTISDYCDILEWRWLISGKYYIGNIILQSRISNQIKSWFTWCCCSNHILVRDMLVVYILLSLHILMPFMIIQTLFDLSKRYTVIGCYQSTISKFICIKNIKLFKIYHWYRFIDNSPHLPNVSSILCSLNMLNMLCSLLVLCFQTCFIFWLTTVGISINVH